MTEKITLYTLKELEEKHPEAYKKALKNLKHKVCKWDMPHLTHDLENRATTLINEHDWIKDIDTEDIELSYSLSYSQGDGLSFTGKLIYRHDNGLKMQVVLKRTNSHYYHKNTVQAAYADVYDWDDELENMGEEEFKDLRREAEQDAKHDVKHLHDKIADELEKYGYDIIEYRESEENIKELAEINEWRFTESGQEVQ